MIVPMRKLTLVCLLSDRAATLEALAELGVVHLTPVHTVESKDVEKARAQLVAMRRVYEALDARSSAPPTGVPADALVSILWLLMLDRKEQEDRLVELKQERDRIAPLGDFDPAAIAALREAGVYLRLYRVSPGQDVKAPEGSSLELLSADRNGACYALVSRDPAAALEAQELRLPERSLRAVRESIAAIEQRLAENELELANYAGDRAALGELIAHAEEHLRFLEAREGMGDAAPVAYLRGYFPAEAEPALRAAAARHGWGLFIEAPGDDDPVPTLVRNPAWVRPIRAVFDAIGIAPGYREMDISACFLFFLSIFFAMLVGDAGYGLLFLGLTWFARRKLPQAPAYGFHFMYVMSLGTIVWGALTGVYFGWPRLPGLLERAKVPWLADNDHIMLLCFVLGATHLTVAHLWNALRSWRTPQALAQLGWIGTTWTMFFAARTMVLGEPFPGFVMPVFLASVGAIVLFMTPVRALKSEWFNHVMLPLSLVSNFVDVVSYLRLFAVGTASFAVASSFNEMALAGGGHPVVQGAIAAFILFFGHTLNILLAAMGVLVHGVRLNTLEFSSHLGMQWSGVPYLPFARRRRAPETI